MNLDEEDILRRTLLFHLYRNSLPYSYRPPRKKAYEHYTLENYLQDEQKMMETFVAWIKELDEKNIGVYEMEKLKGTLKQEILDEEKEAIQRTAEAKLNDEFKTFNRNIPKKLREQVLARDHYTCQYCGIDLKQDIKTSPHIDHIKPYRSGGRTIPSNLKACCWRCNLGKRDTNSFEYIETAETDSAIDKKLL